MLFNIEAFARDVAVLTLKGAYTLAEIAAAYELTEEQAQQIMLTPEYTQAADKALVGIDADNTQEVVQAQARLMMPSTLRMLQEVASNPKEKTSDRLKAANIIADLADIKPKQEQGFTGMVLNVSFGSLMPAIALTPTDDNEVIEHE